MPRKGPRPVVLAALWLTAWVVYAAYFQGQWVFGERPIYHITGDEPHYLVVATSLLRDGDLDVLNNYRDKDFLAFYPHHLGDARDPEDMHALYGRGGHLYSKHGLGLSLLVLAPLAVGGHGVALLCLMALTAALGVQIYLLARDVAGPGPAAATWLALAFSPPLLLYADQFYPEVPGALLTIVGLRAILAALATGTRVQGTPRLILGVQMGVAVALLPWFHLRYLPLSAVLAVSAACVLWPPAHTRLAGWRRRAWGPLLGFAAPAAVAGAGLLTLYWRLFRGVPTVDEYGAVAVQNLLLGAPGLLLDQQYGLLTYAPVFLIALLGLPLIAGSVPGRGGLVVWAVLGCYFLFIASFSVWYGSFSPPARMLVPLVPVLGVPFALAVRRWRAVRFRVFAGALLVGGWSIAHLLMDVPWLRYNTPTGESEMLRYLSQIWGVDLVPLFPSFQAATIRGCVWFLAASAGTAVLWLLLTRPPRTRRARRHAEDAPVAPPEDAVRSAPVPAQSYRSLHDVLTVEPRIPPGQRIGG